MRNGLSDDSVRSSDRVSQVEPSSNKRRQRMYGERYRENIEDGQYDVSDQRQIPDLELSRGREEKLSRDFSSPESSKKPTKLTEKDGPRLSGKEVSLKDESLQRGVLHEKVKPKKKEVDLKKARKKAIKKEQYKRLHFDDRAVSYAGSQLHQKVSENSDDNSSVEAANEGLQVGEGAVRKVSSLKFESGKDRRNRDNSNYSSKESSGRLHFDDEETEVIRDKPSRRKEQQKRAIKKQYAAKKRNSDSGSILTPKRSTATKDGGLGARLKEKIQNFVEDHKGGVAIAILIGLGVFMIASSLTMCGPVSSGSGGVIIGTSYLATDEEILAAEAYYCGLESALQTQIDDMETSHPDYDEYQYQIDEISHDPYALISYLTVLYGEFEADDVESEMDDLFAAQYQLNVWETTETRTREVERQVTRQVRDPKTGRVVTQTVTVIETEEYEYHILNVELTNHGLNMVVFDELDDEEFQMFQAYQATCGNRRYLFGDPIVPPGISYQIPPDALSDERFANMIAEAEKYLGYPYVFGGSSPSTSFDCSGFVSWVINNCGNGWSIGRQTASGLLNYVTYVSPAEAQPGDIIFFEKTYDCDGPASHVGIYVGDGMMIHCGKPIQYTSINTPYWQEHFLCFGRLP